VNRIVDADNRPVIIGSEIARGGEGVVYEVPANRASVAKIYLRPPDANKIGKLTAMGPLGTPDILKFAAWPTTTLHQNGSLIGILMPRVPSGVKAIHELYTPKTRVREFPSANWQFLVNVAINITRAFASIHRNGHVIGDVNHGNILVGPNAIASFIDCDSFQIRSNGKIFPCEVGVSTYTPPELQHAKAFNQIVRTPNHDSFGLAVLIFHLLFMGRHPFAGKYSGTGYMPIERAIAECRFAFGRLANQMQMSPPPDSLLLSQIATTVADAFERAFGPDAAHGASRPSAMEWLSVLEQFQRELARCKSNPVHIYYARLSECPWCRIECHGVILFIDLGIAAAPSLNIEILWAKLTQLPQLVPFHIPSPGGLNLNIKPTREARELGRKRKTQLAIGIAAVIVAVIIVIVANLPGFPSLILIVAAIIFAYKLPQKLQRERSAALEAVSSRQREYQAVVNRYVSEVSEEKFAEKLKDLNTLRAEYTQLPLVRQKKLQELDKAKLQLQLHQFLDQISLSTAHIRSIGPGRKAMLASFGIDSAADITYTSVTQVPEIGPKYAENLLAWRRTMEARFRFDPSASVPKTEIERVERDIRNRRSQLEGFLTRGVQEAVALHSRILMMRKTCVSQVEKALESLGQAQANSKVG